MSDPNIYAAPQTEIPAPETIGGINGEYASFWQRFGAIFIDGLITGIIGFAISAMIGFLGAIANLENDVLQGLGNISGIIIGWLYNSLLESSSKQASLGKQIMKLQVSDLNGNRISFARASGRHFGKTISGLILGIGYLIMLGSKRKQTLHDQMAGCLVWKTH